MELNAFLQPVGSPITVSSLVDGYDFDSDYDRSSITSTKVRTISADKIAAGTVSVTVNVGGENIVISGEDVNIKVYDGTVNRVLVGKF